MQVEEVAGVGKVSAVVSDNAANMKKAGKLIELKHPNVVFNGCSAHAVNLLLKDIFKLDLFAEVLKKAAKIVKFVRARHLLLNRVRTHRRQLPKSTKKGELSAPVSTRWYAQEKCIKSVVRNKMPLQAAFADTELMNHYADRDSVRKLAEVRQIIGDKPFWRNAKVVLRLTKPITQTLAVLEADACSNSMIIHEFIELRKAPEYNEEIAGLVGTTVQEEIRKLIESRRKFIRPPSDSTTIAYLMDPSKSLADLPNDGPADSESDTSLGANSQVGPLRDALAKAVQLAERFGLPPGVSPAAFRSELLRFIKKKKTWTDVQREDASQDPPLDWWTLDIEFPLLHNFAEKILSIPTSSAASERLWSVHGFTHSKLRNRLKVATVEKLSFIYTNSGDTRSPTLPVYKSTTRLREPDSDSEADVENDDEDDFLFDFNDMEFEYLLDAIVSVEIDQ
ncbi:hypothetical protein PHMEG_00026261 [Phytophthora megakarya]|uniref:HAT C-terminal dimerisation domain-containing protein n=1 Tax=Phytophthora megakarya TaxID=4795 RepID=A0A225V8Y4_9STRA|nr:hypothetical protein PHMEG_00026261 [Phytophthora megakarya]